MVAGIKTLEILDRPGTYEHLDRVSGRLIEGILQAGRDAGHDVCGGHINGENFPQLSSWSIILGLAQRATFSRGRIWRVVPT